MVKLTTAQDQEGGGQAPSDTIITYSIRVKDQGTSAMIIPTCYRSQADLDAGESSINLKNVPNSLSIPIEEFGDISGAIDLLFKSKLENIEGIGVGNVEVVI
jgi:hypothetical protein